MTQLLNVADEIVARLERENDELKRRLDYLLYANGVATTVIEWFHKRVEELERLKGVDHVDVPTTLDIEEAKLDGAIGSEFAEP
ncbi:MAG: hypothetical protein CV089_02270 [Nitrospira sp. WS110]|nr:hypothetical protein [Nitrospira sp. WS110]